MLEFKSIHKWKTAVLYLRNCLVKFCRINDENPDKIGVFLGYIFFVASWWQRYKDSNLNIRSQRLAIFFQNCLFKPFFRLGVSQKSLSIVYQKFLPNSYDELRTLQWGVSMIYFSLFEARFFIEIFKSWSFLPNSSSSAIFSKSLSILLRAWRTAA